MKMVLALACLSLLYSSQTTSETLCKETLSKLWKACDYIAESQSLKTFQLPKNTPIALQVLDTQRFSGGEHAILKQRGKEASFNELLEQKDGLFLHYIPKTDFVGKDTAVVYIERYLSDVFSGSPQKKAAHYTIYTFEIIE